jgi:hypothetical protein
MANLIAPLGETILGSGTGGPLSLPSQWVQGSGYIYYPFGVVIGTPAGGNEGNGTLNVSSLYINGSLVNLSQYLPYAGGTMTGSLSLYADPSSAMQAATKQYVDNKVPIDAPSDGTTYGRNNGGWSSKFDGGLY